MICNPLVQLGGFIIRITGKDYKSLIYIHWIANPMGTEVLSLYLKPCSLVNSLPCNLFIFQRIRRIQPCCLTCRERYTCNYHYKKHKQGYNETMGETIPQ